MSKNYKSLLTIGISGVTCGGKTTTATQLSNVLPSCKIFSQDDYFLNVEDPRHTWIPELNHINFDIISSLDMEKMHQDILDYIRDNNFKHVNLNEKINLRNGIAIKDLSKYIHDKARDFGLHILIIEGFSIFNYKPLLNLFNLKYYFTLSKEECERRRNTRVYEPPDCPGYFEKCVWPEHLIQLEEVKENVKDIIYFKENTSDVLEKILGDILKYF